jgi:hypothetical protein
MKKISFLLFICVSFYAIAQSPLEFSKVIQADGKSQTQ